MPFEEYLALADASLVFQDRAVHLLRANRLANPQETGECVLNLLDAVVDVLSGVQMGLDTAGENKTATQNDGRIQEKKCQLTQARERLRTRWPWIDPVQWERTGDALAHGQYQTAGEILAELHLE
jgi:hypothetical protein